MKALLSKTLLLIPLLAMPAYGSKPECQPSRQTADDPQDKYIRITIGSAVFKATLQHNASSTAFMSHLPITLEMNDLHRTEKYGTLANPLPADASNPGRIHNGDLMLFGSGTLVLFYASFDTSYSYTRLGKIDQPSRLGKILGGGKVKITFERDYD